MRRVALGTCATSTLLGWPLGMERRPAPHPPALQAGIRLESMWDVYRHTWLPFGGLLTDMEAVGMAVDRAHLAAAQQQAEADQAQAQERFRCAQGAPTARSRVRQAGWARSQCKRWRCHPGAPLRASPAAPSPWPLGAPWLLLECHSRFPAGTCLASPLTCPCPTPAGAGLPRGWGTPST